MARVVYQPFALCSKIERLPTSPRNGGLFKTVAFSNTATRDLSDPSLDPAARAELEYTLRKVK